MVDTSTHNAGTSSSHDRPAGARGERAVVKRTLNLEACGPCRRRKRKCGYERPSCKSCVHLHLTCTYETRAGETRVQATKRNLRAFRDNTLLYEEFFRYLRTTDAYQVNDVFQRIRSGFNIEDLMTHIRVGDLQNQVNLRPETQFRYELPYVKHMPPELLVRNRYIDTLIYESASLRITDRGTRDNQWVDPLPQIVYLRPIHAARFEDALIENTKPSLWTLVCQDDIIMRRLLQNHFLCEFYFMSALQKDLFLEDMASQQGEFCSSLLVNAVLAYACVCDLNIPNRAEYWNPSSLTYRFLVEAKRLWEIEAMTPRISTLQAGIILNGISNLSGLDQVGQTYRKQCVTLANHLNLFDGPVTATTERSRQGKLYTAWAFFCWDALVAHSLQQTPLLPRPPHDSLPSSADNSAWYGRFRLQYPGHDRLVDANFGALFEHRARFRVLLAGYCHAVYGQYRSPAWLMNYAYLCWTQLCNWFDDLPPNLQPETIVLPAQLQLHMDFHQFLISVFEPLTDMRTHQEPKPGAIVHKSNKYFATLLRLYYIRHGHHHMDIHIIISLIFAGTRCLDNLRESPADSDLESLRQTLVLCATGIYNQRHNNFLAQALYSAFRSRMSAHESVLLQGISDMEVDDEALSLRQATLSSWIPTVMSSIEAPDDGSSSNTALS